MNTGIDSEPSFYLWGRAIPWSSGSAGPNSFLGVVTGKFDPILNALLNNEFGLLELMIKEVAKVSDALSTETFVVYKNYDMKIPYIL